MKSDISISPVAEQFQNELEMRFISDTVYVAAVRKLVEHIAAHRGFAEQAVTEIGLCLNEAVANIIRHAYSGATQKPIRITVEFAEKTSATAGANATRSIRIVLRDWGTGLYPQANAIARHDPLQPGGLGLICLKTLMDEVIYTPQPDGMILTLVKRTAGSDVNL